MTTVDQHLLSVLHQELANTHALELRVNEYVIYTWLGVRIGDFKLNRIFNYTDKASEDLVIYLNGKDFSFWNEPFLRSLS